MASAAEGRLHQALAAALLQIQQKDVLLTTAKRCTGVGNVRGVWLCGKMCMQASCVHMPSVLSHAGMPYPDCCNPAVHWVTHESR